MKCLVPWLAISLTGVALCGCASSRYQAARRQDTVQAYRAYLARHPDDDQAQAARRRLEALEHRAAVASGRPLGCRLYLQRYPGGRYTGDCEARLARAAMERARTAADLRLIQERYGHTPQARKALVRLPDLLASQALASNQPARLRAYLDRYPGSRREADVRRRLARLELPRLGQDRYRLESFAQEFAGTPEAAEALRQVERLLAEEVAQTLDPATLGEYAARFPESDQLPRLRGLVQGRQVDLALMRVDYQALGKLRPGDSRRPGVAAVLRLCKTRPRACRELRATARRAFRWEPAQSLKQLRAQVFDADLLVSWQAMEILGWMADREAGNLLLELLGTPRMSTLWIAERALRRWYSRQPRARQRLWARWHRRRTLREANADEAQRRGYLALMTGDAAEGRRLLRGVSGQPSRSLCAGYLTLRGQPRGGGPAPPGSAFIEGASRRVDWLKSSFPAELNRDSLVAGTLAERELFALTGARTEVEAQLEASPALARLQGRVAGLLARWRAQLAAVDGDFRPARRPRLEREVARHEQGRAAALRALRARRDAAARAVAAAIERLGDGAAGR
jgi:hypothetical protein